MNQIVAQQAPALQVPAHLAQFYSQQPAVNIGADVAAGISSAAHNRISIRQSRWRMVDTQGVETTLNTFHADVLIVDANPNTSKTYYEGAYRTDGDNVAPKCFSDNGLAPSDRVSTPISYACASCPMNAFGSKVTEEGKRAKQCADSKRLAVVMADNPDGPVYELRVPAASLTNMAAAMNDMIKRGARVETMVWRLEFDPQASHPKINFTAIGWVNEPQMAAVNRLLGSAETATVINKDDRPMDTGARQLQAPQPTAAAAPVPTAAPSLAAPQYQTPAPQATPPLPPAAPVTFAQAAPVQQPVQAFVPPIAQAAHPLNIALPPLPAAVPQQPVQAQAIVAEAPKARKPRRSSAEVAAEKAAQAAAAAPVVAAQAVPFPVPAGFALPPQPSAPAMAMPVATPAFPSSLPPTPQAYAPPPAPANHDIPHAMAAAAAVPVTPQPTNPQLDALLNGLTLG